MRTAEAAEGGWVPGWHISDPETPSGWPTPTTRDSDLNWTSVTPLQITRYSPAVGTTCELLIRPETYFHPLFLHHITKIQCDLCNSSRYLGERWHIPQESWAGERHNSPVASTQQMAQSSDPTRLQSTRVQHQSAQTSTGLKPGDFVLDQNKKICKRMK